MKRLISGIQPTGVITLGNYLGAIKNFVKLQNELEDIDFLVFIADLHAITIPQDPVLLRKNIKNLAAVYVACGLDPQKVHLFIQSEVLEHAELGHMMQCIGGIGELERMTQYKDKKQRHVEGVSTALLTYPCLMAADILLYDTNIVPVGEDQKQHLELTRDLAIKFNSRFGETFVVPEPYIAKQGARIMSLIDPSKKMSKSDPNPKAYIGILDDLNQIKNKIKGAVTDLDGKVKYDEENKPGISNLMTIYSCMSGLTYEEIEKKYDEKGYAEFKTDLAEIVVNEIKPIQEKFNTLINSKELDEILDNGRDYATYLARKKMAKVRNRFGIGRKIK